VRSTATTHSVLKKNYKAKFSIGSILKKKINEDNFLKKNITKKMEKKPCGKHCGNPQCFAKKAIVFPYMI